MFSLDGKNALVTGASGGIGAAIAEVLHGAGATVALSGTRIAPLEELAAKLGDRVHVLTCNLSDAQEVEALPKRAAEAMGSVDILVNNAGVVDLAARVEDMDEARLQRMFATNLTGPFLVAGQAVKRMSTAHGGAGGAIVNLSSAAARLASPNNYVDYAASKAGIDILTVGLALEVAAEGIRVNGIRPGIIITDIHAKGGQPDRVAQIAGTLPMKRAGTADEVAEAIVWLCSDAASYVTAATLDVSGGRSF